MATQSPEDVNGAPQDGVEQAVEVMEVVANSMKEAQPKPKPAKDVNHVNGAPRDGVEHAIEVVANSMKDGQTFNETMDYYKIWAKTYEQDCSLLGYKAPALAAEYMAKQNLPKYSKILDVACGTGWCARLLRDEYGYTFFDGLDASEDMIAAAMSQNIYRKIHNLKIGDGNKILLPDDCYDGITLAGGLTNGHIKLDAFEELIRIVRPGGYIVNSMRENNRQKEYQELDQTFQSYEDRGLWKKISETITKNHIMDYDGLVHVYQVTKQQ